MNYQKDSLVNGIITVLQIVATNATNYYIAMQSRNRYVLMSHSTPAAVTCRGRV